MSKVDVLIPLFKQYGILDVLPKVESYVDLFEYLDKCKQYHKISKYEKKIDKFDRKIDERINESIQFDNGYGIDNNCIEDIKKLHIKKQKYIKKAFGLHNILYQKK